MNNLINVSPTSTFPPSNEADLIGEVVKVSQLSNSDKNQMFALMDAYYLTSRSIFDTDLAEKDLVILLRQNESNVIRGFTTLLQIDDDESNVTALFSGDTILHSAYWGSTKLHETYLDTILNIYRSVKNADVNRPVFWFLISSGYKTYRLLPTFFKRFYPSVVEATPPKIKALMDRLAGSRYGSQYTPEDGIIQLRASTPLRPGIAEIQPHHLHNKHITYFNQANPGHRKGDELVCMAEISPDNFTGAAVALI